MTFSAEGGRSRLAGDSRRVGMDDTRTRTRRAEPGRGSDPENGQRGAVGEAHDTTARDAGTLDRDRHDEGRGRRRRLSHRGTTLHHRSVGPGVSRMATTRSLAGESRLAAVVKSDVASGLGGTGRLHGTVPTGDTRAEESEQDGSRGGSQQLRQPARPHSFMPTQPVGGVNGRSRVYRCDMPRSFPMTAPPIT